MNLINEWISFLEERKNDMNELIRWMNISNEVLNLKDCERPNNKILGEEYEK